MSRSPDRIVVVGGGPVGLAFALAAVKLRDVQVAVIEQRGFESLAADSTTPAYHHQVYALSPASMAFLEVIGAATHLKTARTMPVRRMQVFADGEQATDTLPDLLLSRPDALATIVEQRNLIAALLEACRRVDPAQLTLCDRQTIQRLVPTPAGIEVVMADRVLPADLLVGADGRNSRVREWLGLDVVEHDYQSDAIIANFSCEKDHHGSAFQWFSGDDVMAYLPLPGQCVSIVWSVDRSRAPALLAADEADFCAAVMRAGHHRLGNMALISRREGVPLVRRRALSWVLPHAALIGDAAHAIHPLAGQGVNLGFGDAQCLAALLRDRSYLSAIGDGALLRRYQRSRMEPTLMMGAVTDQLQALFLHDARWAKWVRRRGLSAVNRAPPLKAALIGYALG